MRIVKENLAKIVGARVFSKLDANLDNLQVPWHQLYRSLPYLSCQWDASRLKDYVLKLPQHLHFFQWKILRILEGTHGDVCHMGDNPVFGKDKLEHDKCLREKLRHLLRAGITLNVAKCEFPKLKIKFLGHVLDGIGILADPEKSSAITRLPAVENVAKLGSFLEMVKHLAKFLPNVADKVQPLLVLELGAKRHIQTRQSLLCASSYILRLSSSPYSFC